MSDTSRRISLGVEGEKPKPLTVAGPEAAADATLEERIVAALRTVFDPEIPVDIYELGLIYKLDLSPTGEAKVRMTLTSPACPVAGSLVGEVERKVRSVPGVTGAKVELVWDPPWERSRMSEAAALHLGLF